MVACVPFYHHKKVMPITQVRAVAVPRPSSALNQHGGPKSHTVGAKRFSHARAPQGSKTAKLEPCWGGRLLGATATACPKSGVRVPWLATADRGGEDGKPAACPVRCSRMRPGNECWETCVCSLLHCLSAPCCIATHTAPRRWLYKAPSKGRRVPWARGLPHRSAVPLLLLLACMPPAPQRLDHQPPLT